MIKWIRYSGASIILSLNPLYWKVLPWFRRERNNEWPMVHDYMWAFGFLGITVRVWFDNGDW